MFFVLFWFYFSQTSHKYPGTGGRKQSKFTEAVGYCPLRQPQRQKHQKEINWESKRVKKKEKGITAIKLFRSECDRKEKKAL